MTIEELLESKEGEQVQFKEAKNRFDSDEAARCCCGLSNCGGGKLVLVLNAVSHRNYQMGGSIFVRQYRDRLVVEKPGWAALRYYS